MTAIKRNWGIIGILFIAALLLMPATQAEAKTVKYKIIAPLTRVEWIAVPDVERHSVVLYERRGVVIFENGETAQPIARGVRPTISKVKARFMGTATYSIRTVLHRYLSIQAP